MTEAQKIEAAKVNHAMVKVHQLLQIARDIAYDANLQWLMDDLETLDAAVRGTHKDFNRDRR